MLKRISA